MAEEVNFQDDDNGLCIKQNASFKINEKAQQTNGKLRGMQEKGIFHGVQYNAHEEKFIPQDHLSCST